MTAVLTPTVRQSGKRGLFWIIVTVFVVVVAIGALLLSGASTSKERLDPTSPAPAGAKALMEVLRQQGVDVTTTTTLSTTIAAIDDPIDTTLVVYDPKDYLAENGKYQSVATVASNLVVLEPSFEALATFAPGVAAAGKPDDDPLTAGCDLPAAQIAKTVSSGGVAFRVKAGTAASTCLMSTSSGAPDAYSYIRLDSDTTSVSVIGATDALTNEQLRLRGNAAFALRVLGEKQSLVFYTPSAADLDGGLDPASVTPAWLTPVILLTALGFIVAGIWRGRRFGPLIIENLPVDVKSSETMEGRARLYERGSSRLRALDAVRMGTVTRLAARVGLPVSATVDEVAAGVAAALGAEVSSIRSLLVDAEPAGDAQLVQLSDALLDLEARLSAALRS